MDFANWPRNERGGLKPVWPVPGMAIVGARFRNARVRARMSQHQVAFHAGVSQSSVSRLERGVCGGMRTETLIRIAISIGGFPFGYCPHGHKCGYPFDPRTDHYTTFLG
jgi:DNA-binding XRE family transcriptional regulator